MATQPGNRDAKITLYWLEQSRAQSILWLLEELQIPYRLKTFKRGSDKLAPPELKKIHPLGKSPVVTIERAGQTKPLVLAESGLIVEYLVEHFGGVEKDLVPARYEEGNSSGEETEAYMRYRFYMHYTEGSLMPLLVFSLVVNGIRTAPVPFFIKPVTRMIADKVNASFLDKQLEDNFAFLEEQLKTAPGVDRGVATGGVCGKDMTAADILMSFPIIAATSRGAIMKEKYPELVAYAGRLQAAEGYRKAVAKVEETEGKFVATL